MTEQKSAPTLASIRRDHPFPWGHSLRIGPAGGIFQVLDASRVEVPITIMIAFLEIVTITLSKNASPQPPQDQK